MGEKAKADKARKDCIVTKKKSNNGKDAQGKPWTDDTAGKACDADEAKKDAEDKKKAKEKKKAEEKAKADKAKKDCIVTKKRSNNGKDTQGKPWTDDTAGKACDADKAKKDAEDKKKAEEAKKAAEAKKKADEAAKKKAAEDKAKAD